LDLLSNPHSTTDSNSLMYTSGGFVATDHVAGGLAVATAVAEDDDSVFIPNAVEFDPDAKPAMDGKSTWSRKFRCYVGAALVLLAVLVTGAITTGVMVAQDDGNDGPTMAPTSVREALGIRDFVENMVGPLEDETSPEYQALEWITNADPLKLTPTDETLPQRYALAYFYYATTINEEWRSCNPATLPNETSYCAFQQLVSVDPEMEFDTVPWIRWLSEEGECQWAGVECDEAGIVRSIALSK
jgi:hypothetical protein